MIKRILIILIPLILSLQSFAQLEVKEGSFKEVPGFVNINPDENYQTDDNDLPFAVIKVRTENINDKQRRDLRFEGNAGTFIMLEYKIGEVWVYLTAKYADYIKISHPDFSSIEFALPFDLEPKKGYEMILVNKPSINEEILKKLERLEALEKANNVSLNYQTQTTNQEEFTSNATFKYLLKSSYETAFSVGPDKKVVFSKGNLQYQFLTNTWRFAEHQWDIIGKVNKKNKQKNDDWIDLFGWFTGDNPTQNSTNNSDYSSFNDWGDNISGVAGKNWRTLTKDEWVYVFNIRVTNSGIRFVKATVNDVDGVILLPDNWNVDTYNLKNVNRGDAKFDSNIISQTDWNSKFDANGAVFLPVAGWRYGTSILGVDIYGYYWSATKTDDDYASGVCFSDSNLNFADNGCIRNGRSVRLVCDVE